MNHNFKINVDFFQNQLLQAVLENLASAPSSPIEGQMYYDTTDETVYFRSSSSWVDISGGSGDVSISGTPVNNQLAVWTDASTIEGDSNLVWDDDQLFVTSSDATKSGLYITNTAGTAGVTIDATLGESWLFGAGGSAFVFRNQTDGEYRMNIPNNASGVWFGADASFVNPGNDIIFANTGIVNSAVNIVIENSSAPSGFSIEHTGTTRFSNTFTCGGAGNPSLVSNWNLTGAQDNSSYDSLVFSLQSTTSLFSWSYYPSGGGSNAELMTLDTSGNLATEGGLDVNGTYTVGTPAVGDRDDLPTIFGDDTAAFSRLFFSAQNNKNLSVIFTPQGTGDQVAFQLNNSDDLANRGRFLVWLNDDTAALAIDSQGSGTPITTLQLGEGDITSSTTGDLTKIGFWFDKVEEARVDSDGSIHGSSFVTESYTVANLPTGETGMIACVTDASSVSYRATATGGGSDTVLVFYDGINWIYH